MKAPQLIALLCSLLAPFAAAEESMLEWFSPQLREANVELRRARSALAQLGEPVVGQTVPQFGYQHLQMPSPPPESPWVQVDLGTAQPIDTIALIPALVDFQPVARGAYGFPRRFRVDISDDPKFGTFTPLLVHTEEDFLAPGVAPVVIPAGGKAGRFVRLTVTRLAEASNTFFFALAEIMVLRGNRNVAIGSTVTGKNSANLPPRWSLGYLVDGRTPLGPPIRGSALPQFDAFFATSSETSPAWMGLDLKREVRIDELRLHPLHARQGADVPGFAFPVQFHAELAKSPDFSDAVRLFDSNGEDWPNPGNNPVTLKATGQSGRYVRIVMDKASPERGKSFALSELEVYEGETNVARTASPISSGDPLRNPPRPGELLTDGFTSFGQIMELPVWLEEWRQRREAQLEIEQLQGQLPALEEAARKRAIWVAGLMAAGAGVLGIAVAFRSRRARVRELEKFRARLAQDLHDEIGSNLAGIARLSETAAMGDSVATNDWREVNQIARETTDAMREVLWLVGGRHEMGIDLIAHLQLVSSRLLAGKQVHWLHVPDALPATWPVEHRRQVFLFFKEALANVVRHSRASAVELSATLSDGTFELIIRDNGKGFEETKVQPGLGLRGLRERARSLHGTVTIDSSPGRGTCITLRVPVT